MKKKIKKFLILFNFWLNKLFSIYCRLNFILWIYELLSECICFHLTALSLSTHTKKNFLFTIIICGFFDCVCVYEKGNKLHRNAPCTQLLHLSTDDVRRHVSQNQLHIYWHKYCKFIPVSYFVYFSIKSASYFPMVRTLIDWIFSTCSYCFTNHLYYSCCFNYFQESARIWIHSFISNNLLNTFIGQKYEWRRKRFKKAEISCRWEWSK